MKIGIRYKPLDSVEWVEITVTPEQYFEPTEDGRPHEWEDVPEKPRAADYLPFPASGLSQVELKIWEPDDRLRLLRSDVYWHQGLNTVTRQREAGLDLWIVRFQLDGRPSVIHIVRLNLHDDGRLLLEHLQVIETDRGQTQGPSEVLSLPGPKKNGESDGAVQLRYRLVGSADWQSWPITVEDYYARDNTAEHTRVVIPARAHAWEHLPVSADRVAQTETRLYTHGGALRQTIVEALWNGGLNWIVKSEERESTSLTLSIQTSDESLTRQEIHLSKDEDGDGFLEHRQETTGTREKVGTLFERRRL